MLKQWPRLSAKIVLLHVDLEATPWTPAQIRWDHSAVTVINKEREIIIEPVQKHTW